MCHKTEDARQDIRCTVTDCKYHAGEYECHASCIDVGPHHNEGNVTNHKCETYCECNHNKQ